jgi:hypothetical protein
MNRRLVAFGFCVLSQVALAATEDTKSSIYDLQYLPKKGTVYGESKLGLTQENYKINSNTVTINSSTLEQNIGYSFTNNLLGFVSGNYLLNSSTNVQGSGTTTAKGISDPTVGARFRLFEQVTSGVNVDFIPKFSFNSGDREINNGNNKNGAANFELTLNVGKKFTDFQVTGFISYSDREKGVTNDLNTNLKIQTVSYTTLTLGAQGLKNINEFIYISGIGAIQATHSYNSTSPTTNLYYPSTNNFLLGAEVGYVPKENMLFSFLINEQIYSITSDVAGNSTIKNFMATTVQFRARYQF